MRRLVSISAILAALAAAAPASGAVLSAKSCGSSCSNFSATGTGWVSVVANGAEWGSMSSGTIWVRGRSGQTDVKGWVHGSGITWTYLGDNGWRATSKHAMTVNATGNFWVKVQGPGIQVCSVIDGSGKLAGSGKYSVNGGWHAWTSTATSLQF